MNKRYQNLISQYIKAKDNSKPHLMAKVFAEQAVLKMNVQTDNIAFPAEVLGVDKITHTLVQDFNNSYDNIYTLCITDSVDQYQHHNHLSCRWLVCMTEKSSGSLRLGYGDYHWCFEEKSSGLISQLTITIDDMQILPEGMESEILSWFDTLPYPWALSSELKTTMPDIELLYKTLQPLFREDTSLSA
ncbi:hypothetical protein [Amphritea balenae]|uniref:SnoaL-like domain-containing protein n=1 Tax=Amphritea balenae TaxID=452629 RepID=A0A3P1SX30_9GAMM|nr:hypothetical protein [Amphritea balenae]RRD01618.1 hypothetical protein EHS89_03420 [Amphritea balenae]GGK55526.1 hypothetical protein GCM10007941_02050 [Amphritea balenae]